MWTLYAFRDNKSGALSNFFVTAEPFSKVKQNVSVSLLQLSLKETTNPFVLFSKDFDLVSIQDIYDDQEISSNHNSINLDVLLTASRSAFDMRMNQTSPTEELDKTEE